MANGNVVLSCVSPVSEQMVVKTRTPKIRELQRRNLLTILGRQPTDICFKKKTAILQCWWCWGKVHYDLTWEERARLASGNVPWIVSHIIKKLNLENNGASFAFFALTGRVVTSSMSQLRGAWEKIIRSKGETVWNIRYRKSYPLIKELRVS
jgi:hypothetical protein